MQKSFVFLLAALVMGSSACTHGETAKPSVAIPTTAAVLPAPQVDGALGAKLVPAARDTVVTAQLTIDSRVDPHAPRPALNVALCLDTSGSMEGKAIDDARKAALSFLAGLKPGDAFSLVTFDSTARVLVPPTQMNNQTDLAPMRAAIASMRASGTTAMTDGLRMAVQEVQSSYDPTRVNRIVLVSDGVPNDASQLRPLARQAEASGISVSAMGLGLDYDEILMGDLAQTGGGRFKYIDDSSKIASYLGDELSRISRVSARSATLVISPGPGVTVDGVIGLPTSPVGNGGVQVTLGDVSLGSHRDVFIKLHAHGHPDGVAVELADAALRWVGSDGASHESHYFFGAHATVDDAAIAKSHDDAVDLGAKHAQEAADAIEAIRRAHESDKGSAPNHALKAPSSPAPAPAPDVAKRDHARAMSTLYGVD
ncbi:MAG: vWA domain-containing protein [Polyangiaceae bacterium]